MNRRSIFALTLVLALAGISQTTFAMPNFARKYGASCDMCHTTIPRLNETGYKFRAAGFRMPEEIGKSEEKKIELGDYFSARLQARYDTQKTNQPNGAAVANVIGGVAGTRTTTNSLNFMEATLYPLTGSWGKYLGSLVELSVSPEDFFEVENAYVRLTYGKPNKFFTSRLGVFHPWEGYGASDRPFSNARPLLQTNPISAGGRGVPYVFQPWGLDEVGAELGGDIDKLSLRVAILGGTFMRWDEEANAFLPFPAQTGPWKGANQAVAGLGKPFDSVAHNTPDFSANATYLLNSNGGGISLLYYRGNIATPTSCTDGTKIGQVNAITGQVCGVTAASAAAPFGTAGNTDFDFTSATAFRNNFDRTAVYLAYPWKRFHPQVGFQLGRDDNPDHTKFNSRGMFAEGAYQVSDKLTAGLRYDFWKPKYATNAFGQWSVTPYVSVPLNNGFQVIAEYQHRDFQVNITNHRQNDTFQARVIFIK